MVIFCKNKRDVVEYVEDMLTSLSNVSPWTMTIIAVPYEDYCVTTATDVSSEDTERQVGQYFSEVRRTTWTIPTPDG